LHQECVSAQWLEDTDLWRVEFLDTATNEAFVRHSRVLCTAVGFLDIPKGPESIANVQEFRGRIFHSSNWDHKVNFEGKDVMVVGNGASANQFVPWLLKNTGLRSLVQIVRSAQWIAPKENQRIEKVQKW
jgi:cation diffusion facilitator CzcD-associated flavoprotein CzcO